MPLRLLAALPLLAVALSAGLAVPAPAAHASGVPALGSTAYLAPGGEGWGTTHPRHVFNGGDPSGEISQVHWKRWGEAAATGRGLTWLLRPAGGYYSKPGRIVLRAEGLGTCPDGTYAYTRLLIRVAHRPGGAPGRHWHGWAGSGRIC